MNEADNTIVFSKGRSVIIPDKGGNIANEIISKANRESITELRKERGVYVFDMWVPSNTEVNTHSSF